MIERWISFVPPAMDSDTVNSASAAQLAPGSIEPHVPSAGPAQASASAPTIRHARSPNRRATSGVAQLAERADRTRIGTVRRGRERSGDEQALADLAGVQADEVVTDGRIGSHLTAAELVEEPVGAVVAHPAALTDGARDALVVHHRRRDAPAGPRPAAARRRPARTRR